MKDSKKGSSSSLSSIPVKPCNFFICSSLLLILLFFSGFAFSTNRLFFLGFCPRLVRTWSASATRVIPGDSPENSAVSIPEGVISPDEAFFFLKYPSSRGLFTKDELDCVYTSPDSYSQAPPKSVVEDEYWGRQIVRCQPPPGGSQVSLAVKKTTSDNQVPAGPTYKWDSLAYEAMIDWDNTTVVFVKGFNLRGGKVSDPTKFRCVYGWDFKNPKFMLHSNVVSVAQEIVRCKTPLSVLNRGERYRSDPIKVSVRKIGKGALDSVARPQVRLKPRLSPTDRKEQQMCVCTMLKNQARFLKEWIMYHAEIGVQRWFIYDNNSDDNIKDILKSLTHNNYYNISRHVWPWIKTQEAGFAHCALRARDSCQWVGFIDVDEFFYLSINTSSIQDVLRRQTSGIAELRLPCHTFGPSGLKRVPIQGVTVGYTCRLAYPERHKSIVRPEALDPTLMNVVHHFRLSPPYKYANIDRNVMVVNHYKYQVWQVFKEKFHRRVATYVSDWQQDRNAGSKDRAPGLGTRAVEPTDWHARFCEVTDNGLRDQVLRTFTDPITRRLPWQEDEQQD